MKCNTEFIRATATGLILGQPCRILSAHLTNDTQAGKVIFYDHDSETNNLLFTLACAQNGNDSYYPQGDKHTRYGLYAVVTGANSDIVVEIEPYPVMEKPI